MPTLIPPTQNWEQESKDDRPITFHQSLSDLGRIIVSCFRKNGTREIIGYLYTEVDGEEIKYYSTNQSGREIYPPTTDFNSLEMKFERHARLLEMERENDRIYNTINTLTKNINAMKNQTQNTETKSKKFNQLIFVEYEKPTKEGHFITVTDSYRNVLGRINKTYNQEAKKYEYQSFDHAGKPYGKSEKIWELKNDFINNRDELLEQAHQRRIEGKDSASLSPENDGERKKETEKIRQSKKAPEKKIDQPAKNSIVKNNENVTKSEDSKQYDTSDQENDDSTKADSREEELEDLRDNLEENRGEWNLEL